MAKAKRTIAEVEAENRVLRMELDMTRRVFEDYRKLHMGHWYQPWTYAVNNGSTFTGYNVTSGGAATGYEITSTGAVVPTTLTVSSGS